MKRHRKHSRLVLEIGMKVVVVEVVTYNIAFEFVVVVLDNIVIVEEVVVVERKPQLVQLDMEGMVDKEDIEHYMVDMEDKVDILVVLVMALKQVVVVLI